MTLKRFVSSAVATIMVMDMLILALAMLPVNTSFLTGDAPAVAAETQQEAGFFGCFVACGACVFSGARSSRSCVKCARCVGVNPPTKPISTAK
jgi:hypothetical protein